MTDLFVPRHENFDDFQEETSKLFPAYIAAAATAIRAITRESLEQTASPHPDGFLKMHIGPENGVFDGQVRLHFWVPGLYATDQPHSHPWHLASRALVGQYSEYQPTLITDPSAMLQEYRVTYPTGIDQRADVAIINPDITYRSHNGHGLLTREGSDHFLAADKIHMSNPSGIGSITLAVMSPRFANETSFYAPETSTYTSTIDSDDIDRVMDMINETRKHL